MYEVNPKRVVLIHGIVMKRVGQVLLSHDLHPRLHLLHILHCTSSNIYISRFLKFSCKMGKLLMHVSMYA
jgi:hypothetical protein